MHKFMTVVSGIMLAAFAVVSFAAPIGDTQGKVSMIAVLPSDNGVEKMRVYFSVAENDRFGCMVNPGFIEVTTASAYVTPDHFNRIYAAALTAYATGNSFAIDSPGGTAACYEGNMAWSR